MKFFLNKIHVRKLLPIFLGLGVGTAAQAEVYWEDYLGNNWTSTGPVDTPYAPGVNFQNHPSISSITTATSFDQLIGLSTQASPAHVRTGISDNIDWLGSTELCNISGPNAACAASSGSNGRIEGRITYAVLRLPQPGTYTFTAANIDDYVRLDSLPVTSSTPIPAPATFRTLAYTTIGGPMGNGPMGSYESPRAGSCLLIRHSWTSIYTANSAQLHWSGPGVTPGVIPDSNLSDPQGFDFSRCVPQVSITKAASTNNVPLGGNVTYTITASAAAAGAAADGTVVTDTLPAGLDAATATWTCIPSGGAVCPNGSGTGNINETIVSFPAGSSVTYTLTAATTSNAPNEIQNEASLTTPAGVTSLCQPGNTPSPCPSATVTTGVLKPVPALDTAGLLGLAALLMLAYGIVRRRVR